jgi:hypothetical protein
MKQRGVSLEAVRKIGLSLPGVEESTAFGAFALKAGKKMFACTPTNKQAEPNSLLLRCDFERRDEMMSADPLTYYAPDHYLSYPSVLVRLARVDEPMMRDLLAMAHRCVLSQKPPKKKKA